MPASLPCTDAPPYDPCTDPPAAQATKTRSADSAERWGQNTAGLTSRATSPLLSLKHQVDGADPPHGLVARLPPEHDHFAAVQVPHRKAVSPV